MSGEQILHLSDEIHCIHDDIHVLTASMHGDIHDLTETIQHHLHSRISMKQEMERLRFENARLMTENMMLKQQIVNMFS